MPSSRPWARRRARPRRRSTTHPGSGPRRRWWRRVCRSHERQPRGSKGEGERRMTKTPPCRSWPVGARLRAMVLGLATMCLGPVSAQEVFKCTVPGKPVYQAPACAGQGKALEIKAGPDEREVTAAKARADAERASVGTAPAPAPATQTPPPPFTQRPVDCAKLNKERGDAFGRRNAGVREGREFNRDLSGSVDRAQDDIRRIEGQMARGGCK